MNLGRLDTCKKVSVSLESLDACREVSVSLGRLETCKRASVSLVSLFEVSHYARFARALAVTTFRHSCAPVWGQNWDHFGTNLGPVWDLFGPTLGPVWDQFGPIWDHV